MNDKWIKSLFINVHQLHTIGPLVRGGSLLIHDF